METTRTASANTIKRLPTISVAHVSAFSDAGCRNLQSTTVADSNSITLLPPNPSREGLWAFQADHRDGPASTHIQTIVIA